MTTADLRALSAGRHALDAAPPPGGYGSIDPVAQVPWALTIAQAWAEDARLERIDVDRVRPDGTVNVADDVEAVVRYRFVSPRRRAELREQRQTSARAEMTTEFWVLAERGAPHVQAVAGRPASSRDEPVAPHPTSALALRDVMARVQAMPDYRAPFLNGYLIHLGDEGWVWYFSTLAGDALPRVRAADGASWPYRRR